MGLEFSQLKILLSGISTIKHERESEN